MTIKASPAGAIVEAGRIAAVKGRRQGFVAGEAGRHPVPPQAAVNGAVRQPGSRQRRMASDNVG